MGGVALRAPRARPQGAATKSMRWHLRGAATQRTGPRRRNPRGARGLRGVCGVARRVRCTTSNPSSRLAFASQAPCARPLPLLGRAPGAAPARGSFPDELLEEDPLPLSPGETGVEEVHDLESALPQDVDGGRGGGGEAPDPQGRQSEPLDLLESVAQQLPADPLSAGSGIDGPEEDAGLSAT